jgi:hypothetical protein
MDQFKNYCVEFWLDSDGFIKSSVDSIQSIKNSVLGIVVTGFFTCTIGQYVPSSNQFEIVRALSSVPISEILIQESNANTAINSLREINSRIDLNLANYFDNEKFSQELTALAEEAILKLSLADKNFTKTASV